MELEIFWYILFYIVCPARMSTWLSPRLMIRMINGMRFFSGLRNGWEILEESFFFLNVKKFLEFHLTFDIISRRKQKHWKSMALRMATALSTRNTKLFHEIKKRSFVDQSEEESCNRSGMIYCCRVFFLISRGEWDRGKR